MALSKYLVAKGFACLIVGLNLISISGCATVESEPVIVQSTEKNSFRWQSEGFTPVQVPAVDDLITLSSEQAQAFLDYYNDPIRADVEAHVRLFNYLDSRVSNFTFKGNTYSAREALDKKSGNCLSLALVTHALAQLVDIETHYRKVHSAPIYRRYGDLMTLSSHVQTRVFKPEGEKRKNEIVVLRPSLIIDYFRGQKDETGATISTEDFIAMYYQNLASEALIEHQYDYAYALLSQAMQISPQNPQTLNSLAVLYTRTGKESKAEQIYSFALENTSGDLNLLSNFVQMLKRQQRWDEAEQFEQRAGSIDDDNPYRWLDKAESDLQDGHLLRARKYFEKALEKAPYLHEAQFGLAKSYYLNGEPTKAKIHLEQALELAVKEKESFLYHAKLAVLSSTSLNEL